MMTPLSDIDKVPDPVHQGEDGKWYFWDETWASREGPFLTEERARRELDRYCREYLGSMG